MFAVGLEFIYDTLLLGSAYYSQVAQKSPIAAFGDNLWQIPSFFAGLYVGKFGTGIWRRASTSKEEREYDKGLKEFIQDTPLVDIVINYKPTEQVQEELDKQGIRLYATQFTRRGKRTYKKLVAAGKVMVEAVGEGADHIMSHGERQAEKDEAAKKERQEALKRAWNK